MTTITVNLNDDAFTKRIFKTAYPDYKGRKFQIKFNVEKMSVRSYWESGGSRTLYSIVRLSDMSVVHAPTSAHPWFTKIDGIDEVVIPEGFVIVSNATIRGKKAGLTIYSPDAPKLLEDGEVLSNEHLNVLIVTRSLKSCYMGDSDARKTELERNTGMSSSRIDEVRTELIESGHMSRRKAITNKGRNAVQDKWRMIS